MSTDNLNLDIQLGNVEDGYPTKKEFQSWVACTISNVLDCALTSMSAAHTPAGSKTRQATETALNLLDFLNKQATGHAVELTIRLVDEEEGMHLNQTYRGNTGATNVLSFPFENLEDIPDEFNIPLLGDIVICAPVVRQEAKTQNKKETNHWAHLTVHGTLHLLGYDHIDDEDAQIMENLETGILSSLGFSDPYFFEPLTSHTDI